VPEVQERFEAPIKAMIEEETSFGYRTVAGLLGFNKPRWLDNPCPGQRLWAETRVHHAALP
jgi:hypothetical protein